MREAGESPVTQPVTGSQLELEGSQGPVGPGGCAGARLHLIIYLAGCWGGNSWSWAVIWAGSGHIMSVNKGLNYCFVTSCLVTCDFSY